VPTRTRRRSCRHCGCVARTLLSTFVVVVCACVQSSGSAQVAEGMARLTEAAAVAQAVKDGLESAVKELEEKVRAKDNRLQSLAAGKAEAESQLAVRLALVSCVVLHVVSWLSHVP
jgi:hypothetical protein